MNKFKLYGAVVALLGSSAAMAQTNTTSPSSDTFNVTVDIVVACDLSVGAFDFGDFTDLSAGTSATIKSVSVLCTDQAPYTVTLDDGLNFDAIEGRRMQSGGGDFIAYELSQPGGTLRWGSNVAETYSGTGNGASQGIDVEGEIAAGVASIPGSYSDTITATLEF